ncbi:MAG TPA: hypothetical protein VFH43_04510 [Candidatus Kapabacteria bacterium]|nr:hypothetical protein [Candidatus Kapabacteria bacterium]
MYVYSNTLVRTTGSGQTTTVGSNDTVRTLGFRGFAGNDSIFAVSIKYQVSTGLAGRIVSALRYLPATPTFGGAYIDGTSTHQGEVNTASLYTRATSTDSITAPTYGRMRSLASDLAGVGSVVWQTDTIYYTSSSDHVAFYAKNAQGNFVHSKDLFRVDIPVSNGYEWEYSAWQTNTMHHVLNDNRSINVNGTTYSAVHTSIQNSDLSVGSTSQKYFASGYGPMRQVESWWTTTDGVTRVTNTLTREGIVVIDWDEIGGME